MKAPKPVTRDELREWRRAHGLSQARLAVSIGLDARTVLRWERAQTPIPLWLSLALRGLDAAETDAAGRRTGDDHEGTHTEVPPELPTPQSAPEPEPPDDGDDHQAQPPRPRSPREAGRRWRRAHPGVPVPGYNRIVHFLDGCMLDCGHRAVADFVSAAGR